MTTAEKTRARRAVSIAILLAGTALLALVSPWTEALGASTGAVCVWLAAVSDPWTWPIGIANSAAVLVVAAVLVAVVAVGLLPAARTMRGLSQSTGRRTDTRVPEPTRLRIESSPP